MSESRLKQYCYNDEYLVVLRLTSPVTSAAVAAEAARPHRGPRPRPAGLVTQHFTSARLHDNFDIVANIHILGENTDHSPSLRLSPGSKCFLNLFM